MGSIGAIAGNLGASGAVQGSNAMMNAETAKKAIQTVEQTKLQNSADLLNSNKNICQSIRL